MKKIPEKNLQGKTNFRIQKKYAIKNMGGEEKMKTKKIIALGGIVALSFVILSAHEVKAEDMLQIANQKGCLACHQIDKQVVGPAWIEVSKKYTEKDIPQLVNSVLNGSMGKWGQVPMPANKGLVTEEEAKKLVTWIVSLKNQQPSAGTKQPETKKEEKQKGTKK
jgi:cytochrome c